MCFGLAAAKKEICATFFYLSTRDSVAASGQNKNSFLPFPAQRKIERLKANVRVAAKNKFARALDFSRVFLL